MQATSKTAARLPCHLWTRTILQKAASRLSTPGKRMYTMLRSPRLPHLLLGRFHSFMQYLGVWTSNVDSGKVSADLKKRPLPVGMLYDNTTVQGSWISVSDMTAVSRKYGRIVNNVTMAMPHSGVFAAAIEPINHIMQPQDFDVCMMALVATVEANAVLGPRPVSYRCQRTIARRECLMCRSEESGACSIGLY